MRIIKSILLDGYPYEWNEREGAYLGNEGSCGTYGACIHGNQWIPAWIPTDSCDMQCADESFSDAEPAIKHSRSYFS